MRTLAISALLFIAGCAASRDVYLYQAPTVGETAAIVGVTGIEAKLETVDGTAFESRVTKGMILRVHVKPGTHAFGVIALSDFNLGHGSVTYMKLMQQVTAEVEPGHVYGFRSQVTSEGRTFRIVDLGTDIDPSCFRPQLRGGNYVSQTCEWP